MSESAKFLRDEIERKMRPLIESGQQDDDAVVPFLAAVSVAVEMVERERVKVQEARNWAVKSVREVEARERVMTCVWCGYGYPPMTPAAQAKILYEHAKICEKSPLHAAEKRAEAAEAALAEHHRAMAVDPGEVCPCCTMPKEAR